MLATGLAGALGVASNELATLCGDKGKVVMTSIFVFVIGKENLINFLIPYLVLLIRKSQVNKN